MTTESNSHISRRNLAAGIAWAVPAVVLAAPAPAFAASPPTCYRPDWSKATATAVIVPTVTTKGEAGPNLTIASSFVSGAGTSTNLAVQKTPLPTNTLVAPPPGTPNREHFIDTTEGESDTSAANPSQPGFQLSQYTNTWGVAAKQNLSLSVSTGAKFSSVSFRVYDLTQEARSMTEGSWYQDSLTILSGTPAFTATGDTSCKLSISGSTVARANHCPSGIANATRGVSDKNVDVAVTEIKSPSFNFSYANTNPKRIITQGVQNWQYLSIGRLEFCLA